MTLNHFISFWAALYYRVLPDVIKECVYQFLGQIHYDGISNQHPVTGNLLTHKVFT